jgi:diphthamide synthase (EF-2-diphthine--ammonia ligase)
MKTAVLLSGGKDSFYALRFVTGDLWHPCTSGIGDMLVGALGVTLVRPAREVCPALGDGEKYMQDVIAQGIETVVISVREGVLPADVIGKALDEELVQKLVSLNVDPAAESGEYQSFVVAAPQMSGRIVFDDFLVSSIDGKNGKEKFQRMAIKSFHVE